MGLLAGWLTGGMSGTTSYDSGTGGKKICQRQRAASKVSDAEVMLTLTGSGIHSTGAILIAD